jgi:hypothetical protein
MINIMPNRSALFPIIIIVSIGCNGGTSSHKDTPVQESPRATDTSVQNGKGTSSEQPLGPPRDLSRKLMTNQLIGARLVSDDQGEWSFTETQFVFQAGKEPLPFTLQLVLLGQGRSASRIEGKWRLEDAKGHPKGEYDGTIVLWEVRGDGKEGLKETKLDFQSVGPVEIGPNGVPLGRDHVKIGGLHEYRIVPGKS